MVGLWLLLYVTGIVAGVSVSARIYNHLDLLFSAQKRLPLPFVLSPEEEKQIQLDAKTEVEELLDPNFKARLEELDKRGLIPRSSPKRW